MNDDMKKLREEILASALNVENRRLDYEDAQEKHDRLVVTKLLLPIVKAAPQEALVHSHAETTTGDTDFRYESIWQLGKTDEFEAALNTILRIKEKTAKVYTFEEVRVVFGQPGMWFANNTWNESFAYLKFVVEMPERHLSAERYKAVVAAAETKLSEWLWKWGHIRYGGKQ